ncbi:MAG: tyrosine--tRNA ligase [Myxococcota bacterium]
MAANAYDVLEERGFIQQVTDEAAVRAQFDAGPVTAYVGLDPTGDSLHVGHLFPVMALIHLERTGHRPIVVLGGGTAMVGDPSGKSEMRQMLSVAEIRSNLEAFSKSLAKLLDVSGKTRVVDNAEWLLDLNYIEFLRDIGRHFSVNRMLAAEAYKLRLEKGLSFIEFNYQLLQAFDFLELRRRYDCRLQLGGDDQWGNILAGVDLCRRVDRELVQGVTFPLLLTTTGEKMGKTAAGAVWLDSARRSPYDYYQYWVNTHDADVARLLGLFTFLPMDEIREVKELQGSDLNAAKSVLAYEATAVVHGHEEADKAHAAAQAAFGHRATTAGILKSSQMPRGSVASEQEIPTTAVAPAAADAGIGLLQLLVDTKLASSKSEARRLVQQNAIKLNDERVADDKLLVTSSHFSEGHLTLRAGKKKVHRVTLG